MTIEDTQQSKSPGPSQTSEGKEKIKFRILIADDDKDVRDNLKSLLEGRGYIVEAVENGKLLLDKLTFWEKYDLVLTDNSMPVMTGLEALKNIRANEKTKNLPVIVLTGDNIKKNVEEAGGAYFMKGNSISDELALIKKMTEDIQ